MKIYILPKYIWTLKSIWECTVSYNKSKNNIQLGGIQNILEYWKEIEENEFENSKDKLIEALKNQYLNYHLDEEEWFLEQYKNFIFIEVVKVNIMNNDIIYRQKINHNLVISFDEDWKILINDFEKRYFKFDNWILYDSINEYFIKDNKNILFVWIQKEEKKALFRFLLKNIDRVVELDELRKELKTVKNNEDLLKLKRTIIDSDFEGSLW
jgi:hypothetical protein